MNAVFQGLIAAAFLVALMSLSLSPSAHDSPVITLDNAEQVVQLFELDGHTADAEVMIKLWDLASQRDIHAWHAHNSFFVGLPFSPDGLWLASGSDDGTTILWGNQ